MPPLPCVVLNREVAPGTMPMVSQSMNRYRCKNGARRWPLLFLLLCYLLIQFGSLSTASDRTFINLIDGSSGCGHLVGITDDCMLVWQNEGFLESFEFPLKYVRSLTPATIPNTSGFAHRFPQSSRYSASKEMWYARVRGAMRLAGVPIGLSDQHLQLSSPSLGLLNIDRRMNLQIARQAPLLSSLGLTVVSKSWLSSGKPSDWESSELGIFSSVRGATLSTPISVAHSTEFHLRIRWEGTANFLVGFGGKHHARQKIAGRAVQIDGNRVVRPAVHHDGILALEAWAGKLFFVQEFGKSVETVTIGDFGEESGTLDFIVSPESSDSPATLQIVGGPRFELKRSDKTRRLNMEEIVLSNQGKFFSLDRIQFTPRYSGIGQDANLLTSPLLIEGSFQAQGGIRSWDFGSGMVQAETMAPVKQLAFSERKLISALILPTSDGSTEASASLSPPSDSNFPPNSKDIEKEGSRANSASEFALGNYTIGLTDGSRIHGRLLGIQDGHLSVAVAGVSPTLAVSFDSIGELHATLANSDFPISSDGNDSLATVLPGSSSEAIHSGQSNLQEPENDLSRPFMGTAFVIRSQLKGRLVPSPDSSGKAELHWKPFLSRTASPIDQSINAELRTAAITSTKDRQVKSPNSGTMAWQAAPKITGDETMPQQSELPVMIELTTGDQVVASIQRVDQQGIHFHSTMTTVNKLPHAWVRSVKFRDFAAGPRMSDEQKRRLLTVQRSHRDHPPTHLLVAKSGDVLRGNLMSLSEGVLTAEIRSRVVQFPVRLIAEVVWLHQRTSEAGQGDDMHSVRIVSTRGNSTIVEHARVVGDRLIGTSRLFGEVEIPLDQLSIVALGGLPSQDDLQLIFE